MENLALYRKYRPKDWNEVVDQDHIVSVLENSIKTANISHAYLFVGSRGTGKTSLARIFANNLKISPNDTYEIDAASNRGIDDIRELRDGVRTLPFDSKYKIYIIDEVHMLSKDAWGALLKTLEEPPAHVIFILATTELHKVPDTIISRCQVFNFKKPTDLVLRNHLSNIAKEEGFTLAQGADELLAILGDGSFRDALGILDKVLNFAKKDKKKGTIDTLLIESITNAPKRILVNEFLSSLVNSSTEEGLEIIRKASSSNLDMELFLKLILQKFRLAVIIRYAPSQVENMKGDLALEDLEFLKNLVKEDKKAILRSRALTILLEAYANLNNAFIPSLPLELSVIKILNEE
jgi:DNA polymerase-3 subunit gamma/tau